VIRLLGNPGAGRREEVVSLSNNPSTGLTEGEGCVLDQSMAELRAAGNSGAHPLIVLSTAKPYRAPAPRFERAVADLNQYYFHELQPRLAALSACGRLVMQDGATEPASIVQAIQDVVNDVRGTTAAGAGTSAPPE
jgi:hypothetical protein